MYELLVEGEFAGAHNLKGYEGLCEHLHGHNWKVACTLRSEKLNELGMVIDFKKVKALLGEVLDQFDHRYLNDLEPFREENPTTENLARYIFKALQEKVPQGTVVAKVTVWESTGSAASYSEEKG
jgi:6-pyruvoyltetrahydropterin/6-carboxytetrahydropterin synthase